MEASFIEPADPRWNAALEALPHDVYHLPGYVALAASQEGGSPAAILATEDRWAALLPLILRPLPAEFDAPTSWIDAASPYGYPGPVAATPVSAPVVARFMDQAIAACAARGIISLFIRLHPLLGIPTEDLKNHGTLVRHGRTVVIDLRPGIDTLTAQMRKSHRYEIRALHRSGFSTTIDDWSLYPAFVDIYLETMQRLAASDQYLFSLDYFRGLRAALRDRLHLCVALAPEGRPAAAGLFSECGGLVQYLFSGTADEFRQLAPTKLVLSTMIDWACRQGFRTFHLGGGLGGQEDSLFRFKAGFSDLRGDFGSLRVVVDGSRYAAVTERWRLLRGPQGEGEAGFFPIYRGPGSQPSPPAQQRDAP